METNYLLEFLKEIKISVPLSLSISYSFMFTLHKSDDRAFITQWIIENIFQSFILLNFLDDFLNNMVRLLCIITLIIQLGKQLELKYQSLDTFSCIKVGYLFRIIAYLYSIENICWSLIAIYKNNVDMDFFSHFVYMGFKIILFIIAIPLIAFIHDKINSDSDPR